MEMTGRADVGLVLGKGKGEGRRRGRADLRAAYGRFSKAPGSPVRGARGSPRVGEAGMASLPGSATGWGSPRGCGLCAHERWVSEPSSRALGQCF